MNFLFFSRYLPDNIITTIIMMLIYTYKDYIFIKLKNILDIFNFNKLKKYIITINTGVKDTMSIHLNNTSYILYKSILNKLKKNNIETNSYLNNCMEISTIYGDRLEQLKIPQGKILYIHKNNKIIIDFKEIIHGENYEFKKIIITLESKKIETIEEFLKVSYDEYNNKKETVIHNLYNICFFITRNKDMRGILYHKLINNINIKKENLFFNEDKKIYNYIDLFKNNKINKFCLLLHGIPGTGKTSLIKYISKTLNRSILYIKLSEIQNINELMNIFYKEVIEIDMGYTKWGGKNLKSLNLKNDKKLIVFEDIDAESNIVFKRNENIIEKKDDIDNEVMKTVTDKKLSLSDILQVLDGIVSVNKTAYIITTNHVDKLDPALIRPGRIDLKIDLGEINNRNIKKMIQYYFPNDNIEKYNIGLKSILPSKLKNLCLQSNDIQELLNNIKEN